MAIVKLRFILLLFTQAMPGQKGRKGPKGAKGRKKGWDILSRKKTWLME